MTKAKVEGRMRFKEFGVFNKALLAKQGWRMMQNKEALWVRILKRFYFPNCSFLKAKKEVRVSWCWNSLLEGREVIKEYGLWRIGEEKQF